MLLAFLLLVIVYTKLSGQTTGNLTFSCSTAAPAGNWGNKHVLAIWITNSENPAVFIKTNAKYGSEDDHLTAWGAVSSKNLVDAVTGPTLSSYGTSTIIWNGTNTNELVVPDGTYNVFIEMGWGKDKVNQHSIISFSFSKGPDAVHLNPTGNSNYSAVSVDWVPLVTLTNKEVGEKSVAVFPNPTTGIFQLKFAEPIQSSIVLVISASGSTVFQQSLPNNFHGNLDVDLRAVANGIYFIKIITDKRQFNYKIYLKLYHLADDNFNVVAPELNPLLGLDDVDLNTLNDEMEGVINSLDIVEPASAGNPFGMLS